MSFSLQVDINCYRAFQSVDIHQLQWVIGQIPAHWSLKLMKVQELKRFFCFLSIYHKMISVNTTQQEHLQHTIVYMYMCIFYYSLRPSPSNHY